MSIQTDGRLAALASGARLLARAGTLDEQLDGLAAAACTVSGAASSVIYLLDGEHGVLLAGGSAGIGDLAVEPVAPLRGHGRRRGRRSRRHARSSRDGARSCR